MAKDIRPRHSAEAVMELTTQALIDECKRQDGGCKTFCVNDLFDSGKQREEIVWGLMGN